LLTGKLAFFVFTSLLALILSGLRPGDSAFDRAFLTFGELERFRARIGKNL